MKSLVLVASGMLWAAALVFSPAPAQAVYATYPTSTDYFACSQYENLAYPEMCMYGLEEIILYGKMKNTIPLSLCAGSCNGTESLLVAANPGNGRKRDYLSNAPQCGNQYILDLGPCNTCS